MKTGNIKLGGTIIKVTKNGCNVLVDKLNTEMLCYLSGKLMQRKMKPVIGDRVEVEFHADDHSKGRIIRRF